MLTVRRIDVLHSPESGIFRWAVLVLGIGIPGSMGETWSRPRIGSFATAAIGLVLVGLSIVDLAVDHGPAAPVTGGLLMAGGVLAVIAAICRAGWLIRGNGQGRARTNTD